MVRLMRYLELIFSNAQAFNKLFFLNSHAQQ